MQEPSAIDDVTLVLLVAGVSAVGIVLSMSCSWMTTKKRRVAGHAPHRRDGLMLRVSDKAASPHMRPNSHRYSKSTPVIIVPISSLAQTLITPTIIITPPSPLAILADNTSIRSESSIGSAGDLLIEEDAGDDCEKEEENDFCGVSIEEEKYCRERKRYIKVDHQFSEPELPRVHRCDTEVSDSRDRRGRVKGVSKWGTQKESKVNQSGTAENSWNQPQTIMINVRTSDHTSDVRMNAEEGQDHSPAFSTSGEVKDTQFDPVLYAPRPRLKSMEPGTKRSDFQYHRASPIAQVEVGNS